MTNRIIAVFWFTFVSVTSIFFFVIALFLRVVTAPLDSRLKVLQQFTCMWASLYTWIVPAWRIRIEGRKNIKRDRACVVVANHQSLLDILVIFRLFFHFKFVSKVEIFKIPFIGWNMYLNRYIRLKRGHRKSVEQMMTDARAALAGGSSVLIFPEGSRSPDGKVREFRTGAFFLAKSMQVPILPIAISGTNAALPKHSLNFHGSHEIRIRVLEEIPYEEFSLMNEEEIAEWTRRIIIDALCAPENGHAKGHAA